MATSEAAGHASGTSNNANDTIHSTSPQPTAPGPTSPSAVHEKATYSYYGPQPPHQHQPQQPQSGYFAQYPQSYGQPFQPYIPQQAVPPPPPDFRLPGRSPPPPETKAWRNAHIALHATTVVFAICDIALTLSLLKWGIYAWSYYGDLALVALYMIVTPVIALLWSGSELIVRCVRTGHKGITPGAHVGVCLIIWLVAIVTGGITATYSAWLLDLQGTSRRAQGCSDPNTPYTDWGDDCDERDYKDLSTRQGIFVAITVFKFLVWAVVFTIFVRACIEVHRRNAAAAPRGVVYVPYWAGPPAQGWQPLPQQGQPAMQESQGIPMQNRQPRNSAAPSPQAEVTSPAPTHNVQEFYTPGSHATAH
ncbi:hypothetical protein LIA77_10881 [Sarocladium implicatum]|nr:hypothetical protein LIA77_10881 [Sarocladium implicatum]